MYFYLCDLKLHRHHIRSLSCGLGGEPLRKKIITFAGALEALGTLSSSASRLLCGAFDEPRLRRLPHHALAGSLNVTQ